jgi:nitroimidazol reductase NimA-like FMN-containing flavoprotein (pyridoxamine 5'-phosphate oxidase superfamily)
MQKKVQQIRDIAVIEKELAKCPVGLIALYIDDEKLVQVPTTFLYLDKNIFFFIEAASGLSDVIKFNTPVSFAIIRNEIPGKNAKKENYIYHSLSIKVSGGIKIIEDPKIIEEVKQAFILKYSQTEAGNAESLSDSRIYMIDTEEIQAAEETGE